MKTLKLIIIFLFVIQYSTSAQWDEKNVMTNTILIAVSFTDDDNGFVAGGNEIYRTIDGGENWEISFLGDDLVFLEDVVVIENNSIIAVGKDFDSNKSIILKTNNSGNSWEMIPVSGSSTLNSIFFVNSSLGFCSGGNGVILKSTDGGENWQSLDSGTSHILKSIFFVNELVGIAVGGLPGISIIVKTVDGGDTWETVESPSENSLQSVFFVNIQTGYVVGWNGEIIKTENCGTSWTTQTSVDMSGNLEVLFTDDNTGYIVGGQSISALIQKTDNKGTEWNEIGPDVPQGLISICFPSFNTGYAVGNNGTVLKTTSGGVVTSTNQLLATQRISLFPNPVNDSFTIQLEDRSDAIKSIKMYNVEGKLIQSKSCNNHVVIFDVSELVPNNYYLEIQSNNRSSIKKIVKL